MKENTKQDKTKIADRIAGSVWILLLTIYGIACVYLYYMQSNHMEGQYFESDLPYHINMAMDGWGYSLTAILYKLLGFVPGTNLWIAIVLALCTVGAILATYYVLKPYLQSKLVRMAIASASGLAMPFFIRGIQHTRYIGYQSPSIWHNSTYIVMKLLAVITLFLCFYIAKQYGKKLEWKHCIWFAVLLALTTATKTSFVAVFAPAALIMLIADGLTGIPVKKLLLVAATIIPTILVVLFQEAVLFGEDTGNGIVIEFGYTVYLRAEKPQYTMILSALFPVLIFLFNVYPVFKDTIADIRQKRQGLTHREFLVSWIMWVFGALELLFLKETGRREKDANFTWGYSLCLFVLFIFSSVYFVKNLRDPEFLGGKRSLKAVYGVTMGAILGYHVYCGIYFFLRLLEGTTYFM